MTARFAPSPTGSLHIGGARTALFNYLWARHNDGKFLLRFEDTDSARSDPAHEESILQDLLWLGIKPDGEITRQSSRIERHISVLEELKARGAVYPCFCGSSSKVSAASPPSWDSCRGMPPEEAHARLAASGGACWRFAIPLDRDCITFSDLLRGDISIKSSSIGDFVAARSDGTPTYLFAVVVDDHDSGVTHVIRGEEHLSNVSKQKLIYEAMGWSEPFWAHIPMILDTDRHKLSKRSGAVSISQYRDEGWSPEAIVSYLATLSWSGAVVDRLPAIGELADRFDIESVALFSPVHDPSRMRHFGKLAIGALRPEKIYEDYGRFFPSSDDIKPNLDDRMALVREVADASATTLELEEGLKSALAAPLREPIQIGGALWLGDMADVLSSIPTTDWCSHTIKEAIKKFQKEKGLKGRELYHTLRLTVTGRDSGPPIPLIMSCIGRNDTLGRIAETTISRQNGGI